VIFDKNISYGNEGATCTETKAALFEGGLRPTITNYIVGLGGKSITAADLEAATIKSVEQKGQVSTPQWIGVAV
jgi:pyruvate ferredoxin oxidoreductase alpha subunit